MSNKERCQWVTDDLIYQKYHDEEWGIPSFDDRYLFEMLSLEGAQAGLSWLTILKRRDNYRKAFANFDPVQVSRFTARDLDDLMQNKGIIRNYRKIESVIINARCYLAILREFGSFYQYLTSIIPDSLPIKNDWESIEE